MLGVQPAVGRLFTPEENRLDQRSPLIDGIVVGPRGPGYAPLRTSEVFLEGGIRHHGRRLVLRAEVFNVFNHANVLGRIGVYGNAATPNATFATSNTGLANLDPARMVQFEARILF